MFKCVNPYIVNRKFIISSIISVVRHMIIAIVKITTMCTSVFRLGVSSVESFMKIGGNWF